MVKIDVSNLVKAIKNGESHYINSLLIKVRPLILSMIKRYGFYESFEDNYQSAMVVLLESLEEYEPEKNVTFPSFYKLKLFYHFMALIKEQDDRNNFTQDTPTLDQIPEDRLSSADQHLDDIIWREDRLALYEAINKLTTRQKWLIEEHFYKGKKLTELSVEYKIHYQSLVKLKARALKLLKTYLTQQYLN